MNIRNLILERANAICDFPGQKVLAADKEVLTKAKAISQGRVFFYQKTAADVGLANIDWSGSHIRHKQWPAQLNRFYHLPTLASAYQGTGDEEFAEAAKCYIEDWIRYGGSYEHSESLREGDNTLTMGRRLGTSCNLGWGGTLPVFMKSPAFDVAFLDRVLQSIETQALFLSRHLSRGNNWRIVELDALVFTAIRFPWMEHAGHFLHLGIRGMRNALATQFFHDGAHIERTPSYAVGMTQVAVNYYRLSKRFPEADAGVRVETVLKSLDYIAQSQLSGFNDSHAPLQEPDGNTDWDEKERLLRELQEERKHKKKLDKDEQGEEPEEELGTGVIHPLEQVFPDAGQVFLRSAWKKGAEYIAFDAAGWWGGHSHLSRLSFVYRSGGRILVADPGSLGYDMSYPFAHYGKATLAHSTLNVKGGNQSDTDATLLRTEFTTSTALIHARYQGGYWEGKYGWRFEEGRGKGVFGSHERILFWVKGEYLLVLDAMKTEKGAEVNNVWPMGPMDSWCMDESSFSWWSENPDTNVLLQLVVPPKNTLMDCFEGSHDPLRGWVNGDSGGEPIPAPLVEYRYPAPESGYVVSAVLLAAFSGKDKPRYVVKRAWESNQMPIHHLELIVPSGLVHHIAWTDHLKFAIEDEEPFITDGTFVWASMEDGKNIGQCFILDGSYMECVMESGAVQ